MEILKIKNKRLNISEKRHIISCLIAGRIVVLPTDTIYGFHARADSSRAVKRIRRIKRSDKKRPFLFLVSDLSMTKRFASINRAQMKLLKKYWPGPFTVILNKKGNLLREATGGKDSVAVRLPKNKFLDKIIKGVGAPIVSTSLNLSTGKPAGLEEIEKIFKPNLPDLVVDAGCLPRCRPSRIIDLRDPEKIVVVRR